MLKRKGLGRGLGEGGEKVTTFGRRKRPRAETHEGPGGGPQCQGTPAFPRADCLECCAPLICNIW